MGCPHRNIIRLWRQETRSLGYPAVLSFYGRPVIGQTLIFSSCRLFALSIFFYLFSRLISAAIDWMSTILHTWCGLSVNLRCRSETCCTRLAENTARTQKSRQKSPSGHHRTTLSGYIFATKARIDNRKKLLSSNMSSICPHNMVNFGPLATEIDPVV